jgi:hypothetical protein
LVVGSTSNNTPVVTPFLFCFSDTCKKHMNQINP